MHVHNYGTVSLKVSICDLTHCKIATRRCAYVSPLVTFGVIISYIDYAIDMWNISSFH